MDLLCAQEKSQLLSRWPPAARTGLWGYSCSLCRTFHFLLTSWEYSLPSSIVCPCPSEWQHNIQNIRLSDICPRFVSFATLQRVHSVISSRWLMKMFNSAAWPVGPWIHFASSWTLLNRAQLSGPDHSSSEYLSFAERYLITDIVWLLVTFSLVRDIT